MTNLEKVLRYTRSTKSRKARLDAHFAREATHVLTRAELEEQLNSVPNQHKASFLYLPSAYSGDKSLAIVGSDLTIDRNSTATEVNRDLLLEEVEADVPRFQFSEDGYEGHLIEGQGTNLFVFSDPDLEGRLGSRINASLSLNDWGIGLFSNKVILDNTSGGALWYPNESVIIASGLPATICAFIRVIDGLSPTFGPNSNQGYFNVGGSAASAYYVTNLGNDIYFVYAHGISNGATNTGFLRWTYNAPGQIEITGMMLLEGHVHLTPSSYIPTNGAAATRLAEGVPLPSAWANATESDDVLLVFSFTPYSLYLTNRITLFSSIPGGSGSDFILDNGVLYIYTTLGAASFNTGITGSNWINNKNTIVIKKIGSLYTLFVNGNYLDSKVILGDKKYNTYVSVISSKTIHEIRVDTDNPDQWTDEYCQNLSQL